MAQVLSKKRRRPPRKPITHVDAWGKIQIAGNTLIETGSLRHNKDKRAVELGISSLSQTPTSEKERKFRNVLDSTRTGCHPHSTTAILLCCIAVGKDNIINMNEFQRSAFLDKLKSECNGPILSSPVLKAVARSEGIPEPRGPSQSSLSSRRGQSNIDGATFEHAFLEGLATIFSEDLCRIISRVPTQVDGETVWKAAVTTAFPLWGGLVNCLMSLDICTMGVDYLARALFGAKINQAEPLRYIDFDGGPTLIVPDSETTLKGVKEEAIMKVFGVEIQEAIRNSPVRRKELEQGRQVTECVSMIVTRQGAIVNLSLDIDRGFEISHKLYA